MRVVLTELSGRRTPDEFPNEIAASRDLIGVQTAENSPEDWYNKAGPISDIRLYHLGCYLVPVTSIPRVLKGRMLCDHLFALLCS